MNNFRELKVWQKSMKLITDTYCFTQKFPYNEMYGLTSQIRRSAISIASNIAEGCGRKSNKELSNFLSISLGSAYEFETQLIICKNLDYLDEETFERIESEIYHIQNMIVKLSSSIEDKQNTEKH